MAGKVKPVPEGYHTATPYLIVKGAAKAIEFYKQAFGATELERMEMPDGKIAHAEVKIGDSIIMLGDESPQHGTRSPQSLGRLFLRSVSIRRKRGRNLQPGHHSGSDLDHGGQGSVLRRPQWEPGRSVWPYLVRRYPQGKSFDG